MNWFVIIVIAYVVWLAIALLAGGSSIPRESIDASYTGTVIAFETSQSYGTWGTTNHTHMIIETDDHSAGLNQVRITGHWTRRRFKIGDHVTKRAGERIPHRSIE